MAATEIGAWGEERAANYLRLRGYRILARNCRYRQGELDIVARKGDYIVFIEVKLRKNNDFGEARDFVTYSKQQKCIAAAQMWLAENETELQPRFDVIEVYAPNGMSSRGLKINHIINCF